MMVLHDSVSHLIRKRALLWLVLASMLSTACAGSNGGKDQIVARNGSCIDNVPGTPDATCDFSVETWHDGDWALAKIVVRRHFRNRPDGTPISEVTQELDVTPRVGKRRAFPGEFCTSAAGVDGRYVVTGDLDRNGKIVRIYRAWKFDPEHVRVVEVDAKTVHC